MNRTHLKQGYPVIRDCPLGSPEMHSGASAFPLWSVGLSSTMRWPMLHYAFSAPPCGSGNLPVGLAAF